MALGDRGSIKGSVLISRLKLVRDRGGQGLYDRVLARLDAADREVLSGILLASSWYPFPLNERLDAAIVHVLGGGDETYKSLGRQSASDNLSASHRNFARTPDPHALFRQAATIYKLYYDSGSRTYEAIDRKKARVRTLGSKSFSRTDCLTIVGYFERATEILGGKNVKVSEPRCRARRDEVCEYVVEWE